MAQEMSSTDRPIFPVSSHGDGSTDDPSLLDTISAGVPLGLDALAENRVKNGQETLKYLLLGPSLLKAGQETVDQTKVSDIIYNASRGSKYFQHQEERDRILSSKIEKILAKKARLEQLDLSHDLRLTDNFLAQLESERDLSQTIVHIDCDAFYAAVEVLERPELGNVPFAVGGGVLATCNYAARRFGCRSGMAGFVARKLCPQLVVLKPDFVKYNAKAHEIRKILGRYDPRFESASIDEAYLNVTEFCASHGMRPAEVVAQLRREIAEQTHVTVSAGVAANMRLAKICSNMNKPNGQYELPNNRAAILHFMETLPCRKVNGIGHVLERELTAVGIKACGDVYTQRQFLGPLFGEKTCHFLLCCYLGLGRTCVQPAEECERKSVGTESTFESVAGPEALRQKLRLTANELEKDLCRAGCKGRTLVLKIKLHTFEVYTRQVVAPRPLWLADDLYNHALPVLSKLGQEVPDMRVRLMGLRCTHLVSTRKPDTHAFFGLRLPTVSAPSEAPTPQDSNTVQGTNHGVSRPCKGICQTSAVALSVPGNNVHLPLDSSEQTSSVPTCYDEVPTPNPAPLGYFSAARPDQWDCPVCFRPQPADELQFDQHIDTCLSRRAILEVVHESSIVETVRKVEDRRLKGPSSLTKSRGGRKNKRKPTAALARRTAADDPRQKRLCFEGRPATG